MSKKDKSQFQLEGDLLSLRALIAVVDEGGFSAAAKRIHRTQSAVSLQIAKLEARLNSKLLERSTRSVALTPAGETFISYARRILELADEAVLAVTSPEETTLLRVGVVEYLAPQHLHTLLARFRRAHPNCDLSLVLGACSDILEKLNRGDMDIVFAGPDADGGQLLWEEPLVWTGTLDSSKAPVELVLMPAPCHYRQMAFAALTKARRPWKLAIEANSVQAVQSAIRAGLGASVLPLSAVLDDMPLIGKALPKLPKTSVLSYVRPDLSHPYAQRFVDFLLAGIAPNGETGRTVSSGRRVTRTPETAPPM